MKRSLTSVCAAALLACLPAVAPADSKLGNDDVEAIVKKVIREHPEIIIKSLQDYQQREELKQISEAAQNISKKKEEIQNDPRSPVAGNPDGDITVTEFFDYHCGYCKKFYPEIVRLLKEDRNVRIVFKEFPILSPDSVLAAKAALAVYTIDKSKYFMYHTLLMQTQGEFTETLLVDKAKQLGIDEDTFKKAFEDAALDKDIDRNKALAGDVNISGTPAIIVGSELMPGAMPYDVLKEKIAEARDFKGKGTPKQD
jgi:protein-disulfide isomerase